MRTIASRDTRVASIRRACIVLATHVCESHDDRRTTELRGEVPGEKNDPH
jgi:hypothetical protein